MKKVWVKVKKGVNFKNSPMLIVCQLSILIFKIDNQIPILSFR